ncbi:hypothetical protein JHK85_053868 [Glycine max]|nr:hypothetical protein JHK85_053868 [Glycine max]
MKTYLDGFINPQGWMEWSGNFALNTLYYGEYIEQLQDDMVYALIEKYEVLTYASCVQVVPTKEGGRTNYGMKTTHISLASKLLKDRSNGSPWAPTQYLNISNHPSKNLQSTFPEQKLAKYKEFEDDGAKRHPSVTDTCVVARFRVAVGAAAIAAERRGLRSSFLHRYFEALVVLSGFGGSTLTDLYSSVPLLPCLMVNAELKANSTFPDKAPSSGASPLDQQSLDPPQSTSAGRVASLRQLSNSFAQFNNLHLSLRSKKPLTRKDAAAINERRFAKIKEYKERNVEVENEAFDRYMQNVDLLEEVLAVKSLDENVPSALESNPTRMESNEAMIPGLKLQLRSNSMRSDGLRMRIQQIVDEGLKKLEKSAAGTPVEGAAWLRIQRLADTWHRILLIPVTGGVIVGMMCGLLEILDQIKQSTSSQTQGFDFLAGIFPTIKAIQAAVTLGTGCSLGPEGPSVDIGKSCANGFSLMMEHDRERKIALVAAGAAAGISSALPLRADVLVAALYDASLSLSGQTFRFNAPVAGCFFAIETVLRPLRAENPPPFTTAMIILASVISSTVSNVLQGTQSAFTIPEYDLKSAAELPLYLILGMLCGVISVALTRLVAWFTKLFKIIPDKFGIPTVVCPALGGFGAGIIALKYPGILYWGFTNVEEILRTGKSASAPGIWLLAQLVAAKVIATALCKGSGLVGGLYAPSLMIGAAAGAVFGGFSAEVINSAIPGNTAVAQPPAYALARNGSFHSKTGAAQESIDDIRPSFALKHGKSRAKAILA